MGILFDGVEHRSHWRMYTVSKWPTSDPKKLAAALKADGGDKAQLSGAVLTGQSLKDVNLRNADLSRAELGNCQMIECAFDSTQFTAANLTGATIADSIIHWATF